MEKAKLEIRQATLDERRDGILGYVCGRRVEKTTTFKQGTREETEQRRRIIRYARKNGLKGFMLNKSRGYKYYYEARTGEYIEASKYTESCGDRSKNSIGWHRTMRPEETNKLVNLEGGGLSGGPYIFLASREDGGWSERSWFTKDWDDEGNFLEEPRRITTSSSSVWRRSTWCSSSRSFAYMKYYLSLFLVLIVCLFLIVYF